MAMGKRREQQAGMWVSTAELPAGPGHPFYRRLNEILDASGFDGYVERACQRFYARALGRPSLSPGRYFRLLLVGYFEGLDSERGIAWRAADSLGVRSFLGLSLDEAAPDHSTISRTRRRIDADAHRAVFTWVQERLVDADLLRGKTIGIDATTLEANAAMRSIRRRDSGASYEEYLSGLAKASGIKTPTREALSRLDRRRKKKASNKDWTSPSDPDAKIAKMKDGRTHLAHKAEHAIDTDTGAIVAVTIQGADRGDTSTLAETLSRAERQIDRLLASPRLANGIHCDGLTEVVADKGYHSTAVLADLEERGLRAYISEPERARRRWHGDTAGQMAVYANRRRMRGARGKRLARLRGEKVERPFAHLYETGAMRRTHLRGHANIYKRLLVHAGAFNLGLLMRALVGVGKPRRLQGRLSALLARLARFVVAFLGQWTRCAPAAGLVGRLQRSSLLLADAARHPRSEPFTTGC
jgi:transposase